MSIVVQKYGGSSIADVERIRKVADRIAATREAGQRVCAVVSAMGDTTDELLALAQRVSGTPPRRELDMLLSAGERISMALLSMALHERGVPAISFTGSQSGIITDDAHANARIIEVRPHRVHEELERGKVVIVAGYQGVSRNREVTTLGRGGSDTTAVALAAALGAETCEICSDVDGVYSADPRVVLEAKRLPDVSYEEMQELAEGGAKVLNAQAVEFAKRSGIVIVARASFTAGEGTLVRKQIARPMGTVAAVASERDIALLSVKAAPQSLCELAELLDAHHARSTYVWQDGTRASFLLPLENLHGVAALRSALAKNFEGATLDEDLATLSVVGVGLGASHRSLRAALESLSRAKIAVKGAWTTALKLGFLVDKRDAEKGVRALHAALVQTAI